MRDMTTPVTAGYAVNTYAWTLTHPAGSCLEGLASRGHRVFEVMMYPGHLWPVDLDTAARRAFRRFLEERDLSITTLNMPNVDITCAALTPTRRRGSSRRCSARR